jgi:hypothetical protein
MKGQGGTRRVLSELGTGDPQRLFSVDMKDSDRAKVVLAHARWDATNSRHVVRWLAAAQSQPQFPAMLAERLRENPLDPVLLRFEQDAASDGRAAVCERHNALAAQNPANVDLQYIAARCAPTPDERDKAFLEGHRVAPANAWLAMAAGFTYARQKSWSEASEAMERAYANVAVRDIVLMDLARIKRIMSADASAAIAPLEADSEKLKFLVSMEKGTSADAELRPYVELARGKLTAAIAASGKDRDERARVLRLAAASDGADAALIGKALSLKADEGLDAQSLWSAWALAARHGRDTDAYRKVAAQAAGEETAAALQQFLAACRIGDSAGAEQSLRGLTPELLGHGYAMGIVMLRSEAPQPWRDGAKRLLFTYERPYFS